MDQGLEFRSTMEPNLTFVPMNEKQNTSPSNRPLSAAYEQMLFQPGIWTTLGMAKQTVLNARVKVRNGVRASDARMRRYLAKAGWTMVAEEQWAFKKGTRRTPRGAIATGTRGRPRTSNAVQPLSKEMRHVERWALREFEKLKK